MTSPATSTPQQSGAIPPAVVGLSFVSLWNDVASEMVYPLLPNFIVRTLGGGAAILGVLDGAAELTGAALKWISGRLADRPGLRGPLILGGYATAVFVRPLSAIASAASQVVGFRVLDRIGKGLRTAPRDAMIADVTPPYMRGRAFGFHRALDHLGAVVGSVLAWVLLARGMGVRQVIGWSVVPGILALVTLTVVLRTTRHTAPSSALARAHGVLRRAHGRVHSGPPSLRSRCWRSPGCRRRCCCCGYRTSAWPRRPSRYSGAACTWCAAPVRIPAGGSPTGSARASPWRQAACSSRWWWACCRATSVRSSPAAVFLLLGGVAGLTEPAERALVAKLSPKRMGSGFGAFNAITGLAALPAAALFGVAYQYSADRRRCWPPAC